MATMKKDWKTLTGIIETMVKDWKKLAGILALIILFATGILYTIHASREGNYKLYLMEQEFEQMRQQSEEHEAEMCEIEFRDWCLKNDIHFTVFDSVRAESVNKLVEFRKTH